MDMERALRVASAFAVCAAAVCSPSFADTNITENVTLTEDADWTSHGTVNLSGGVVVDLNGHDLRVGGLAGEGRFVSSEELIVNGSFEQIEGATGTHQDFSETVYPTGWTTANANLATVGWAASRDTIWSKNFDAQNGNKFVFWWQPFRLVVVQRQHKRRGVADAESECRQSGYLPSVVLHRLQAGQ